MTAKNIEANLDIFDFDLSEEDMAVLDKIKALKLRMILIQLIFNRIEATREGCFFYCFTNKSMNLLSKLTKKRSGNTMVLQKRTRLRI